MIRYELRRLALNLPLILGLLLLTAINVLSLRGEAEVLAYLSTDEAFAYAAAKLDYSTAYAAVAMAVALGHEFGSRGVSSLVLNGHSRGSVYALKAGMMLCVVMLASLLTPAVAMLSGVLKPPSVAVLLRFIPYRLLLAAAVGGAAMLGCVLLRDMLRAVIVPIVVLVVWERIELAATGGVAAFVLGGADAAAGMAVAAAIAVVTLIAGYFVLRRADLK